LRNGPFNGLEWSFLIRDHGYDCNGKKSKDEEAPVAKEEQKADAEEFKLTCNEGPPLIMSS